MQRCADSGHAMMLVAEYAPLSIAAEMNAPVGHRVPAGFAQSLVQLLRSEACILAC